MARTIIIAAYTNRIARAAITDANAADLQERFRVVTDNEQAFRAMSLMPAETRWIDLGGSELSEEAKISLNARYVAAASLEAAIKWLRMPVTT